MKTFIAITLACACMHANAQQAPGAGSNGHSAMHSGHASIGAPSAKAAGASQNGSNGGKYSMVDNYQPWPQEEMQQFQKPKFVSFGEDN